MDRTLEFLSAYACDLTRLAGAELTERQCRTALELLRGVERLPHLQALFDTLVVDR